MRTTLIGALRRHACAALACCALLVSSRVIAASCAGDCSADGTVAINELISLVNVALGTADLATCAVGDTNGDGAVTINELIAAVNNALVGCPAASGDPAAVALVTARALAPLPGLSDLVAGALDSIGRSQECELGGTLDSACEDTGTGTFVTSATADHCAIATVDGVVESTGSAEITAPGQCPDQLLPFNVAIDFALDASLQSSDRVPLLASRVDALVTLRNLTLGDPPCQIKGGVVTINGPITYTGAQGRTVRAQFDATQVTVEFHGFQGTCDPITVVAIADGPVRIDDTHGDGPFGFAATLHQMTVTQHRDSGTIEIDGAMDADCLGERIALHSEQPLAYPLGQPCFTGGILHIGLPAGSVQATFGPDGGVRLDRAGDVTTYASCLDLPRDVCE
ncbi:hypothetical protein KF840_02035 [bacterium]|nr:hypothetical protein [bacterium]